MSDTDTTITPTAELVARLTKVAQAVIPQSAFRRETDPLTYTIYGPDIMARLRVSNILENHDAAEYEVEGAAEQMRILAAEAYNLAKPQETADMLAELAVLRSENLSLTNSVRSLRGW